MLRIRHIPAPPPVSKSGRAAVAALALATGLAPSEGVDARQLPAHLNPATTACHLHETARQALLLEGWWRQ